MPEYRKAYEKVKSLGGLYIIGSERHESRRIDNQLRGRAGRQGDPGVSQFYVALDDPLMRLFAKEGLRGTRCLIMPSRTLRSVSSSATSR